MSKQDSIKDAIKSYLDERAKTDELFAKSYAKPNKSIDECCAYVWGEVYKRSVAISIPGYNGKGADIPREEVFGMAVHYYDEDDIKVNKMPANVRASVSAPAKAEKPVTLSEEDKEKARQVAIQRLAEEQHALLRKKPTKAKKEVTEVQQMSLF